jgi:light-regulated signal transduction histidine kinase (bacteriophytochrome)
MTSILNLFSNFNDLTKPKSVTDNVSDYKVNKTSRNRASIALNQGTQFKKYQDKIFNLFQTASLKDQFGNKGNGIGLATVKKTIEKLGGKIYVESEEAQGAEFHFSITK